MYATRRGLLVGLSLGGVTLVTSDTPLSQSDDLSGECERLARKLADAFARKHGGNWKYEINHDSKFALIVPIE